MVTKLKIIILTKSINENNNSHITKISHWETKIGHHELELDVFCSSELMTILTPEDLKITMASRNFDLLHI